MVHGGGTSASDNLFKGSLVTLSLSKRLAKHNGGKLSIREQIKSSDGGFTMVELLITVVIIAILTAIAVPAYISVVTNAQNSAAQQTISSVVAAEDLYFSGAGEGRTTVPPGTFASLAALGTAQLIKLDADTSARTRVEIVATDAAFVAVKAENGNVWYASTDNRQPVIHKLGSGQSGTVVPATAGTTNAAFVTAINAL